MRMLFPVTVAIFFFAGGGLRYAASQRPQFILIDPAAPGVYISLVKIGQKAEARSQSGNNIWLSLHNNYRVPIEVPTYGSGVPGELGIVYDILPLEGSEAPKASFAHHVDVYSISLLQPDHSLLFSLPAEDIPDSAYLRISFHFEGERSAKKGGPAPLHFAIFYGSAIPKDVKH